MFPSSSNSFGRTQSTGSIDGVVVSPGSSTQNTDNSVTTEEEDSDNKSTLNYKEKRRINHTLAEQRRRDAIKNGYEHLQRLVPTCQQQDSVSSYKLSKATILQRSIDYIEVLSKQSRNMDSDLESSKKKVMALQIMKNEWESMVKQQQQQHQNTMAANNGGHGNMQQQLSENQQMADENLKLRVFEEFCDELFCSFNESVNFDNFSSLSSSIISWLEEHCKPETLRCTTRNIMAQMK